MSPTTSTHHTNDGELSTTGPDSCGVLQTQIAVALTDMAELIAALPGGTLSRGSGPIFQSATIGQHLRHTLDHVRSIVDRVTTQTIDYDSRDRGTPIEHDHDAAQAEIARLVTRLANTAQDTPLWLTAIATPNGDRVTMRTTHARELAFVLSHTVHHAATIRSIAASFGVTTSHALGLAPATRAHRQGATPCAR